MNSYDYKPLVSINILSFNRREELKNTLQKVYEQSYKNIEIIVVDNASTDGSPQMVKKEFPEVILIELDKNIGIAGWNKGFEIAKGEYVLVLDDDSYPNEKALETTLDLVHSREDIGIVSAKIINTKYNFCETQNYPKNPFSFVGCGALIDNIKLEEVGYFDPNIFIYLNELDLTARFIDKGYSVVYDERAIVFHNQSLKSRVSTANAFISDYRYKHFFWGMSYFILTKFSIQSVILYQTKWLLNRFIIALFKHKLILFFKCLLNLMKKTEVIIVNRRILNYQTQRFYRNGNVFPLVDRDYFPTFRKSK